MTCQPLMSYFFSLKLFIITLTLLILIANDANIGFNNQNAARGIQILLYKNAQNKFCLIIFKVFLDNQIAVLTFSISHQTKTISADSIAISHQVHIAIDRSACVNAGASLIQSQTKATFFHSF